jgi:hypothetical protein
MRISHEGGMYVAKSKLTPSQMVGIFVLLVVFVPFVTILSEPGVIKKLYIIVINNIGFWIVAFLSIVFGFYRKYTNPEKYTWLEFPFQVLAGISTVFVIYSVFFFTTSNIADVEVWNSYVKKAEYYEKWTEEDTYQDCDSEGHCTTKTRTIYHPPEWYFITDINEKKSVNKEIYRNYVNYFRNEKKKNLFHANQVSIGDGDMFFSVFNNKYNKRLTSAIEHDYVNYIKGTETLHKVSGGNTIGFEKLLLKYPRTFSSIYGKINLDRVLVTGGLNIPKDWIKNVDRKLDLYLSDLGTKKEVNILVYLVDTDNMAFTQALEESWLNGKKNDVIVLVGIKSFPELNWVSIIAWTEIEEFKIILRDKIIDLDSLKNSDKFVDTIVQQIDLPADKGGYVRMPMSKLQYLVSDITIPWWANLLVVIFSMFLSWLVSWALINNKIQNWRKR